MAEDEELVKKYEAIAEQAVEEATRITEEKKKELNIHALLQTSARRAAVYHKTLLENNVNDQTATVLTKHMMSMDWFGDKYLKSING